ncbi:MAG: DUF4332 domain-containing protein, partial [Caldilineae bacterium]
MTEEKVLYIWLEGLLDKPPRIHAKAGVAMPLPQFRDRYVDASQPHLVIRVYGAHDDDGQAYEVVLRPVEETAPATPPPDMLHESPPFISLTLIKGIGRKTAAHIQRTTGINSLALLLQAGATPEGRAQLAQQLRKAEHIVLRWVQLADLMRVESVGSDYSNLLWEAGITAIPDLAAQNPAMLGRLLENTNRRLRLVNRLPSAAQVERWVEQAKKLPPIVQS